MRAELSLRKSFLSGSVSVEDWFRHPYFVREQKILENWSPWVEKLKRIPHLPIKIDFDIDKVRSEISNIKEWHPHRLHPKKGFDAKELLFHESSFQGQCLTDIQKDSEKGMRDAQYDLFLEPDAQFDESQKLQFFQTSVGEKMPATIDAIKKISPNFNRSRVIRTPPQGGITWHSHHNGVYSSPYLRLCIANIPIETNEKVIHSVRDYRNNKSYSYDLNYRVGEAYIFNSWHDHQFWNHGNKDRITIIPYFNFSDEDLLSRLKQSIESYEGPLISN